MFSNQPENEFQQIPSIRNGVRCDTSLPVTTASVERGFSKLSIVKHKLRSTMTQERIESLLLSVAEKDILLEMSNDDLVSKFAAAADRRLDLG